ncbi:DUF3568 family protein [Singulisphaera sp. PoT]|uniref:DUF3568 family protein n=1 Tax=Singulisphaera sp. PoT TaxID=3411797 RepID=UPI003BF5F404
MRRTAFTAVGLAGLTLAGCRSVAPMAGAMATSSGFSYSAGRATQEFNCAPTALLASVTGAMEDLRFNSVRQTTDAGTIIFNGTTADARRVSVMVHPIQTLSRVSVRIGWFGDEPLSRALLDRIGVRLGTLPPAAIPIDPPSSPESNPYFSRDAIPDSEMLRDQAEEPYRDSPVP